jgi:PAS domain S-box-containing protein
MTCQNLIAFRESPLRSSLARNLLLSFGICIVATAVKLVFAREAGELGPYALFGLTLIIAGWLGGARILLMTAPVLAGCWWYFFGMPRSPLHSEPSRYATQLAVMLVEATAIALILRHVERVQVVLRTKQFREHFLRELGDVLADSGDRHRVAAVLIRRVAAVLGARRGIVVQRDSDGCFAIFQPQPDLPNECDVRECSAEDLPAQVLRSFEVSEPSWLSSRDVHDARSALSLLGSDALASTGLALPLKTGGGRILGILVLEFAKSSAPRRADIAWLTELGKNCAHALERAALFGDANVARQQLRDLAEVSMALAQALTVDEVARVIVNHGMAATRADTCALYLNATDPSELSLVASSGIGADAIGQIRTVDVRQGAMTFGTVDSMEPRSVPNAAEPSALLPVRGALSPETLLSKSLWSVPLISEGRRIGLLAMGFARVRPFTPAERVFAETFTAHCADALCRVLRADAEIESRARAERMRASMQATLRSSGEAGITTDSSGRVTFMDPTAEGLTGWLTPEAEGRSLPEVFNIVEEVSGSRLESPVGRILRGDVLFETATKVLLVSRDGRRATPIDGSAAPIRGEDGVVYGVAIVFRDSTAKRDAESRLRFMSEVTRILGESLDYHSTLPRVARLAVPEVADWVAVDLVDKGKSGAFRLAATRIDASQFDAVHTAGAKCSVNGSSWRGLTNVLTTGLAELHERIPQSALCESTSRGEAIAGAVDALEFRSLMIVPMVARGEILGAITFASLGSERVYGNADLAFVEQLCGRCAMAIDYTRLHSAEQRARRNAELANTAKDEFLATVSHELRTPLNAIMGWARLLSSPELDGVRRRRGVETIERNSVAMARMIEDVLDVSRIISGKMRLELKVVQLSSVVEAAVEAIRPAAEAKSVAISASVDHSCCPILGDPTRLQQVIWNLLSNAVKFNVNGGRVEVALRRGESTLDVRVTDTGRGIHPGFLPHVFDPFRQAESGYARGRSGLGLGLAIARQLTELHGGTLDVTSDGENCGATFFVRLPIPAISRAGEPSTPPGHRRIASQPKFESLGILRGLRVLVIDDDEDARFLVKTVLEQCGSVVRMSASVADGMSEISRECPDVVVSDIGMPGEDGYDLIRRIRNSGDPRVARVPAAALTAFVRAEDRQRMLRAGYGAHIPKPVEPAELVAAIARLLRTSTKDGEKTEPLLDEPSLPDV